MKFRYGHLCFYVKDLDASVKFYSEHLGFRKMFEQHFDAYDVHCVYLRIAPGQFLELFNAKQELDNSHASFQHLCLHVDDLQAVYEELTAKGLKMTPVEMGMAQCYKSYLDDPDGNKIELMQLTENSLQTIHDHD